jgi:hypothetical protein
MMPASSYNVKLQHDFEADAVTIKDELFQVADAAAEARSRICDRSLQKPLTAIRNSCDEAKRAWSGSDIGYHATVYFEGLQPKPADAEFSPEWGLMDRWPTHQPHPGWRNWDRQTVISQILARAGDPDVGAIEQALIPLREAFSDLKEQAISLLTAALSTKQDPFIDRKLKQIEPLKIADARTIELSLVPHGQYWSRDSQAMSQGLRPAPHQRGR